MDYEPQRYWDELLGEHFDLTGVAYPHLALALNAALYTSQRDNVTRLLDDHGITAPRRVLDIGCGTGFWLDFWRARGASAISGVDLTEASVAALRERFPAVAMRRADVSEPGLDLGGPFDVISAMSVLLHVTDEDRWRGAFANLGAALRPGGALVLVEPLMQHGWRGPPFDERSNSIARPRHVYEAAMAAAGLRLVDVRPASVLLANPMDGRSHWSIRPLYWWWELLSMGVGRRERIARPLARAALALDGPLSRLLPHGPSAKLLLARRM